MRSYQPYAKSAKTHGLDVLCEVHDAEELQQALALDCQCVGVKIAVI